MDANDAKVDCGTCSACCRREVVALASGDDPADFPLAEKLPPDIAASLPRPFIGFVIPHGADGACVYLADGKCSIYDKRPRMCRVFSCVKFVESVMERTTRAERRRDKAVYRTDVFAAGRERLKRAGAS